MPALVARWAQERLWPMLGLVAKEMEWSPVMIFCSFSTANLTYKRELKRIKLFDFDVGFFNSFSLRKSWNALATVHAVERIFRIAPSVNIMTNCPCLHPAMLAWLFRVVNFIFPRGICHESMPFLR